MRYAKSLGICCSIAMLPVASSALVGPAAPLESRDDALGKGKANAAAASSILEDGKLSVAERFHRAIEHCSNAYPNEAQCAEILAGRAEAVLKTEFERAMAVAQAVDRFDSENCDEAERQTVRGCAGVGETSLAKAVEKSQAIWLDYRQAQCASEALRARGGWGEAFQWNACSSRAVGVRADELADMMIFYRKQYDLAPELKN